MAKIRRAGFGTVFNIENEKVGIGTTGKFFTEVRVLKNLELSDANAVTQAQLENYQGFLSNETRLSGNDVDLNKLVGYVRGEAYYGESHAHTQDDGTVVNMVGSAHTTFSHNVIDDSSNIQSGAMGDIIIDGEFTVSSGTTYCSSVEQLTSVANFTVPTGDTDDRIHCHTAGSMRFNEDLGTLEFYTGDEWKTVNSFKDTGNRGICMMMGGDNPSRVDFAHYVNIMTQGNSINFGDLNTAMSQAGGCGNEIRAMIMGGSTASDNSNEIQYTTIGTKGKFQDFGDLSSGRQTVAAVSTSVQATATAGATAGDTPSNILEFVNIMTLGNAVDLGDLTTTRRASGAFGSPTRGVVVVGATPTIISNIEFFTPQSKGNATNWGEMDDKRSPFAFSNSVRGIIAGGYQSPNKRLNSVDYLTIASSGTNVSDFGDLSLRKDAGGANGHSSNHIRGLLTGGYSQPASDNINNIDYINIATAGNALDFGECSQDKWGYIANSTDSHGGLGGY